LNRRIKKSGSTVRWKRVFLCFLIAVLVFVIFSILLQPGRDTIATDELAVPPAPAYKDYFEARQEWLRGHRRARESFGGGETFYEIGARHGLSAPAILRIGEVAKPVFDFSRAKPGQIIDIWLSTKTGNVEKISLHLSAEEMLHVIRMGDEFFSSLARSATLSIPTVITGTVSSCFYESALEKGLPSELAMEFADIFAWDIDFLVDIRPGDSFHAIFHRRYKKGTCVGHGQVIAATFVNHNKVHESFYFIDTDGRAGYYDRNGKSLRKAFLKSPLRYRRISSYFSSRRFHPILKIYRPHYGVDYAAPAGTPVESVGDGRVTFIGWKRGYGRYIRVRHTHVYQTGYGHLSGFARGLEKGSRVRQGDVIGYVGSSGLATGPHLDFSMLKNGRFINPLTVKSPSAEALRGSDKARFNNVVNRVEELWRENGAS
jgi:murein DD-endopeptidase MepM/ murein hydrolase activator NlpD